GGCGEFVTEIDKCLREREAGWNNRWTWGVVLALIVVLAALVLRLPTINEKIASVTVKAPPADQQTPPTTPKTQSAAQPTQSATTPGTPQTTPAAQLPIVVELTASKKMVKPGESIKLEWNAQHADKVHIDPNIGDFSASGSQEVAPSMALSYQL